MFKKVFIFFAMGIFFVSCANLPTTQPPVKTPQEIVVMIPFADSEELVSKFNQFFNPTQTERKYTTQPNLDLLQTKSEMFLNRSNFLLFERDRLTLNVDLRGLGVLSNQGKVIVSPGSLVDLVFHLRTPLGARQVIREGFFSPEVRVEGKELIWEFQPGTINYIEVVLWLPSIAG